MPEFTAETLLALLHQRGLALDAERAAALRPLAESLLGRLARLGETLPRGSAPPPPGPLEEHLP